MPRRVLALVALAACSSSPRPPAPNKPAPPPATARCTPAWVALDPDTIGGVVVAGDDVVWSTTGRGAVMRTGPDGRTTAIAAGGAEAEHGLVGPIVAGDRLVWIDGGTVRSAGVDDGAAADVASIGETTPYALFAVDDGIVIAAQAGLYHVPTGAAPVKIAAGAIWQAVRVGDDIYYEAAKAIRRVPLAGGTMTLVAGIRRWIAPGSSMITLDGVVAWADPNNGIQALDVPATGAADPAEIRTVLDWRTSWTPTLLSVQGGHIYFVMDDTLYRMGDDQTAIPIAVAAASITAYAIAADRIYLGVDRAGVQRLCVDTAAPAPVAITTPSFEPLPCPPDRPYLKDPYEDGCLDKVRQISAPGRHWFHSGAMSAEVDADAVLLERYHDGGKHYLIPLRSAGKVQRWYPDGTLAVDGAWDVDGKKDGTWTYYKPAGTVDRVEVWNHDNLVSSRGHE